MNRSEWSREWFRQRRARGLCARCGVPSPFYRCRDCAVIHATANAASYAKKRMAKADYRRAVEE